MKKLIFSSFFLSFVTFLFGQIPNAGFEGFECCWYPSQWSPITGLYGSISQSSPGHNGSQYAVALNLGNLTAGNGGVSIINVGGTQWPGMGIGPDRPLNLTGFVNGGNLKVTVKIWSQGYNSSTGAGLIGQGSNNVGSDGWGQFTIPISYTSSSSAVVAMISLQNNGGSNSSVLVDDLSFTFNTTETSNLEEDVIFSILPNPASSFVDLKVNQNLLGSEFFIFDQIGKTVSLGIVNKEISKIDLSNLTNGIYFLQLIGDRSRVLKILKE